eukprot:CAMPEP_0184861336 /NCGR_PEP_ID=MMETSP0580-20130426/6043_1 /TAXON_ID=1118495 /ORGANISM="Dactyliosolen fragilissimus" /LENGTH=332 /DNA_ID=CAMNT_0027358791 /DNA_START=370 /DNA_END=1368 /DNA_ORIENTATION=+
MSHNDERFSNLESDCSRKPPILCGVSAGSLVAAGISCGVHPEDAMAAIIRIAESAMERSGPLDVFTPGFSLIDEIEEIILFELQKALGGSSDSRGDYDNELFLRRTDNGRLLHIGLTDMRKFKIFTNNPTRAYVFADKYRDLNDVLSMCMLSSYIPLGTGPLFGTVDPFKNTTVSRSWTTVKEMEELGFLKEGITGYPVTKEISTNNVTDRIDNTYFFDGGISNMWPTIDESTLIVSPLNGKFKNPHISPTVKEVSTEDESNFVSNTIFPNYVHISDGVELGMNKDNIISLYKMLKTSDASFLEERFRDGYDDASDFLRHQNYISSSNSTYV